MGMGSLLQNALSLKWFRRANDQEPGFPLPIIPEPTEPVFHVPPVRNGIEDIPPAVFRHLRVLEIAMIENDRATVGNRQIRLAKLGFEVPTKLSHVRDLMERYGVTQVGD